MGDERKKARTLVRGAAPIFGAVTRRPSIGRRAPIAAILADSICREVVRAAANEARLVLQLDAVRPFGSPAFAASVLLHRVPDKIVIAVLS